MSKGASESPVDGIAGRNIIPDIDSPWVERFFVLHRKVQNVVEKSDRDSTNVKNPKGDDVRLFDLAADQVALVVLRGFRLPLVIDTEESGRHEIGCGAPLYRVVLDPVDGSENRARGLPMSALSCAVLPIAAPLHPDWVEAALVGPVGEQIPWIASKGLGAWDGSKRCNTSKARNVDEAVISIELNHHSPSPDLARLMAEAAGVRCYGCASRALSLVATGAVDAHVDIRGRLTAESYLAGARLVIEAGGWIAGFDGRALPAAENLTTRLSLIAASSRKLCDEIVEVLGDGSR